MSDATEITEHSQTSASSAPRWLNCPGSINLVRSIEPEKLDHINEEASRGTTAHKIATECLLTGKEPWEFFETTIETDNIKFVVDESMLESVTLFVSTVLKKMEQYKHKNPILHTERRMSSILYESVYGTADVTIEIPGEKIIVYDFKNGMVIVEPTSDQVRYYGYLAIENSESEIDENTIVELIIVQPRMPHPKGLIRKSVMRVNELDLWAHEELFPKMELTKDKDAPLFIGKWCQFCPGRLFCPALRKETVELPLDREPSHLTGEELAELARKADTVSKFLASLNKEIYKRIVVDSDKVPGWKMVAKTSHRTWKEGVNDALVEKFGDEAYQPRKTKSPAQLEKIGQAGKDFVVTWAFKPNKGYTVAPEADKKTEVKSQMDQFLDQE